RARGCGTGGGGGYGEKELRGPGGGHGPGSWDEGTSFPEDAPPPENLRLLALAVPAAVGSPAAVPSAARRTRMCVALRGRARLVRARRDGLRFRSHVTWCARAAPVGHLRRMNRMRAMQLQVVVSCRDARVA